MFGILDLALEIRGEAAGILRDGSRFHRYEGTGV